MDNYLSLDLLTASLGDARDAAIQSLLLTAETARHMFNGFHLGRPLGDGKSSDFRYWKGPLPSIPVNATEQEQRALQAFTDGFQTALERSFTSLNMIKSVLSRENATSLSKMNWTITEPITGERTGRTSLEQEADVLATLWWRLNRNHPERALRKAALTARREGRGALRFRVAARLLRQDETGGYTVPAGMDMAQIAKYIRLENIDFPENVRIWEDPDDFRRHAVFSYADKLKVEAAEICTVDQDDKTHLRVLKATQDSSVTLDLGGRITYIEIAIEPLITEQVLQNQMSYNTASTMIIRNTELAGFIERYGVNLEPPYDLVPDPDHPGQMTRKYKPVQTGAGTLNLWRQATYDKTDAQGNYAGEEALGRTAQYGRFEPVSPDSLTAAAQHNKVNVYEEVGQSYVLMGSDATASGRSREVAIADFDATRQPLIDLGAAAIGEILETFLALVTALAGKAGYFEVLQVTGGVKAQLVPPSSLDRAANLADAEAGVISVQTVQQRQGIDEPEAENAQIKREIDEGVSPLSRAAPMVPPVVVP